MKDIKICIDTNFLIDLDIMNSPRHETVYTMFCDWCNTSKDLYIFVDSFLEYLHVVTDAKRFSLPLTMEQALQRINYWKSKSRIKIIYPDESDLNLCLLWLKKFNLGRKRLTDTLMAAACYNHGVTEIWTANSKDFEIFDCFKLIDTK